MLIPAGVLLFASAEPLFRHTVALSASLALPFMALLLPLLWLLFGTSLCLGCILLKKLVMPNLDSERPIQLWSLDFARWWLVHRAIALTNQLFVRHLRGTALLPAYMRALVSILCALRSNFCDSPFRSFKRVPSLLHSTPCRAVAINIIGQ